MFDIFHYEEEEEKIKSCLKLSETAKIDYNEKMKRIDSLFKSDREKAIETLNILNEEFSKKEGCEKIHFNAASRHGEFEVYPISEKEYQKQLQTRRYGRIVGIEKENTDKVK